MQHQSWSLCVCEKKKPFFPSQLLNAVLCWLYLPCYSRIISIHKCLFSVLAGRSQCCPLRGRITHNPSNQCQELKKAGDLMDNSAPLWKQWARWLSVARGPLASKGVLNPSPSLWSHWIPSPWWYLYSGPAGQILPHFPRTPQFQMNMMFSSTSCSHLVVSVQESRCLSVISTQERPNRSFTRKLHKPHFIMTGFLWDKPRCSLYV